jgi:hypothetical protein
LLQCRSPIARFRSPRFPLAWLLINGIGGGLSALIVAGVLAGRAGLPISGGLLLAAGAFGALPALAALLRGRWEARWPELLVVGAAASLAIALGLWHAWPSLLPPGLSVDTVHHFRLISWLAEQKRLPPADDDMAMLLGEMVAYPPGLHLLVVAAAAGSRQPLLAALYPTVALLGGLAAALVALLALAAGRARGEPTAGLSLVGVLLLLGCRTYSLEAYTDHSYYAMTLGALLVLLTASWLVVPPRLHAPGAAQLGLALAALLATYPLWWPAPALLAVAALRPRNRRRWTAGGGPALLLALALGPSLLLAAVDVPARLAVGRAVLAHEGLVATPDAYRLLPLLFGALAAPLVWRAAAGRRLILLAGLVAAQLAALTLAARLGLLAGYHGVKTLFLLLPLAAALAGAGATRLAAIRRPAPRLGATAGVLAAVVLAGDWQGLATRNLQVLTWDVANAAAWLRVHDPAGAARAVPVGFPPGPAAYWVQVGLLGQRRDRAVAAQRAFTVTPPSPASWAVDEAQPRLAVVPAIDAAPPGATVVARSGNAAVLQRDRPLDLAALNPLTIRYYVVLEAGRLKTALDLLHPLAGRLPELELRLSQGGTPVATYRLAPDEARTKPQQIGLDILPATLAGEGYVNRVYPRFAPVPDPPTGAFTLDLRLLDGGQVLDERRLAAFERTTDGAVLHLAAESGELVYVRRPGEPGALRPGGQWIGGLWLRGWHAPERAAPGAVLPLLLRWSAAAPLDRSLWLDIALADASGRIVAADSRPPQGGFYPTWRWRPGEPVDDHRGLPLPPDLPPGRYRLLAGVRNPATGETRTTTVGVVAVERSVTHNESQGLVPGATNPEAADIQVVWPTD